MFRISQYTRERVSRSAPAAGRPPMPELIWSLRRRGLGCGDCRSISADANVLEGPMGAACQDGSG